MASAAFTKHRRFAVRRDVVLHSECCSPCDGRMYELSREGCRVNGLAARDVCGDQDVTLALGEESLAGRVHWSNGTSIVIKFRQLLRPHELEGLLSDSCPLTDAGMAFG